jgi:uncharacterized membrane protein (GlpM family)
VLLLLKLIVAPGLVAAVTLSVRRWGPVVGGWLSGLPTVAGPVLLFLAVEQGTAFAARASHATLAGLIGTVTFTTVYALASRRLPWTACLPIGWLTFVAAAAVLYVAEPSLVVSLVLLFAATVVGRRLLPRVDPPAGPSAAPPGDLPLRLLATATLVVVLTAVAERLGPVLSGLVNAFPVLTTVITAFTHAQRGSAATIAFVYSFERAIIGFGSFCFALALTIDRLGLAAGLASAAAAQVAVSGLVLAYTTGPYRLMRRHTRQPVEGGRRASLRG